jgi:hypothetical protein
MDCIRVLTGEYAGVPDTVAPLVSVAGIPATIAYLKPLAARARVAW